MRLETQEKLGFYPAPPEAVSFIADKLLPPEYGQAAILDPCCGEGAAIVQLARHLRAKPYGIELDEERFKRARLALADAGGVCIGPASFFGCHITHASFSLAWVNPPFDDELGGGCSEASFLSMATKMLVPGGIMCFVCQQGVEENYEIRKLFKQWFNNYRVFQLPEICRKYKGVVVVGSRRTVAVDHWTVPFWDDGALAESEKIYNWRLPSSGGPRKFVKVELTEQEAGLELSRSPLRKLLEPPPDRPLPRPPMTLGRGHLAMLLAAGHLDGVVRPPGEAPHVVRGTSRKVDFLAEETEEVSRSGQAVNKKVYSQKVILTVRTVTPDGKIVTLSQE